MSGDQRTLHLPADLDELHRQALAIALKHGGWAAHGEMERLFARVLSNPPPAPDEARRAEIRRGVG
jgi:hypothetical protein